MAKSFAEPWANKFFGALTFQVIFKGGALIKRCPGKIPSLPPSPASSATIDYDLSIPIDRLG